jgi:hypothetical protein
MRITEFATQLFTKFAPVSTETVANLNVQLSNHYTQILSSMEAKNQQNADLTKKAEAQKKLIESLPLGSPEREEEIFRFTELQDQFEKPTFMERAVAFLDKPLVRVALLVSFAFVARYLAKKLTQPVVPKEEEEELEQPQYANFKQQPQYGYPPQYGYVPQYGYYPPNPPYPQQGKH